MIKNYKIKKLIKNAIVSAAALIGLGTQVFAQDNINIGVLRLPPIRQPSLHMKKVILKRLD